jgi:ribosomal-protein-alanine N-acetyltransferase
MTTEIPPAPPPPFRTERLILRDFRPDDLAAVHEYGSDPEVARYMDWGPNTPEVSAAFLEQTLKVQGERLPGVLNLAVEVVADRRMIGATRFEVKDERNRTADLGYSIHRAYWGRGLVTEATRELLRIAFEVMDLHRVFATCDARNVGSYRVMEKVGMRREGVLRKGTLRKDGWRDTLLYAILAEDWRASSGDA